MPLSDSDHPQRTYDAASVPAEVKTFAASLYLMQEGRGLKRKDFLANVHSAGYPISARSFDRHIEAVRTRGSALSPGKLSGAVARLSVQERAICSRWVLDQNRKNKVVHLLDYCHFAKVSFDVTLSPSTASRYLADAGFSCKTTPKKPSGFAIDVSDCCPSISLVE